MRCLVLFGVFLAISSVHTFALPFDLRALVSKAFAEDLAVIRAKVDDRPSVHDLLVAAVPKVHEVAEVAGEQNQRNFALAAHLSDPVVHEPIGLLVKGLVGKVPEVQQLYENVVFATVGNRPVVHERADIYLRTGAVEKPAESDLNDAVENEVAQSDDDAATVDDGVNVDENAVVAPKPPGKPRRQQPRRQMGQGVRHFARPLRNLNQNNRLANNQRRQRMGNNKHNNGGRMMRANNQRNKVARD